MNNAEQENTEQEVEFKLVKPNQELPTSKDRIQKCLDDMYSTGITHGSFFPNEFFEERVFKKHTQSYFSLYISKIRLELIQDGYYLTARGQKKKGFIITPSRRHYNYGKSVHRVAANALKRGVILNTNTRLDTLTPREQERHERMLRKLVSQHLILERNKGVQDMIRRKRPDLLDDVE